MNIEHDAIMLHPALGPNGLEVYCLLSDGMDEFVDEAMEAWEQSDEAVSISTRFTLTQALDSAIELHVMPAYGHDIDADAKPLFDAMRAELSTMIERIDALKFSLPKTQDA